MAHARTIWEDSIMDMTVNSIDLESVMEQAKATIIALGFNSSMVENYFK